MNLNKLTILLLLFTLLNIERPAFAESFDSWESIAATLPEKTIRSVYVHPLMADDITVAADHDVYRSLDGGSSWTKIFRTSREDEEIRFVVAERLLSPWLYIGTTHAVYLFHTQKNTLITSFNERQNTSDARPTLIAINPYQPTKSALITERDLYIQRTSETWTRIPWTPKTGTFLSIGFHPFRPNTLFLLTDRGIYTIDMEKKTSSLTLSHRASLIEEDTFFYRAHGFFRFFSGFEQWILAGIDDALFLSQDNGASWDSIPLSFFSPPYISTIETRLDDATLFIAGKKNLYAYDIFSKEATHLTDGLYASFINDMTLYEDKTATLFAATDKGLFRLSLDATHATERRTLQNIIRKPEKPQAPREPSIRQVQERAIHYANVHPEKARRWYRNTHIRHFLPSVTIGLDHDITETIDLDRGSTSTSDQYIVGPDQNDLSWGMSLEWDLANLVWDPETTDIDYRERYITESREDILHEVTQLYFERKKMQLELMSIPEEAELLHLEKTIKVEELTALIDALTGGFFTEGLRQPVIPM